MKTLIVGTALLLMLTPATASVSPTTYVVHVAVEPATYDDFKSLTDWITAASSEAPVPDAVLQPGTAAMAEIAAAAEKRVDRGRWLTLNDGSMVDLLDGDVVHAVPHVRDQPRTEPALSPVVIQKGQGFATTLSRKDIVVPSGI